MKEREGAAAAGKPLPIRVDKVKYDELARDLPPDLQAATLVAYTFGWRVQSEVLTLKRRQLDLATATLRLDMGSTKNDDGRVIYLTSEVKAALTEQIARVEAFQRTTGVITPYFFPHLHGRWKGAARQELRKAWATACRKAGCPGRLLHDFRRHRRPQHGAGGGAPFGGDEDHRTSDRDRLPALRDRERRGPQGGCPEAHGHILGHICYDDDRIPCPK